MTPALSQMSISVVAQNTCSTVGEAPFWDPATASIVYVDIKAGDVHVWDSKTGQDRRVHIEGNEPVGFIIPRQSGGYVAGVGQRLCYVDLETGKVTDTVAQVEQGTQNRFNDGKCDSAGRLWAGTMGHDDPPDSGKFVPGLGGLYSLEKGQGIKKHLSGLTIANGMAWSSDNKSMFFIDTPARKVYAFAYDISTGGISNQRSLIDFNNLGPVTEVGNPDGMCIDSGDNIWVACFNGARVIQFDSVTGQVKRQVMFSKAKLITSCCFGGPDYSDLFVTSAKIRISEEEFRTKQPMAGSLFKVTGLGVKGLPGVMYQG